MAAPPTVYAMHTDQVNMPQKLTDATGTVVHDRVIAPFGETVTGAGFTATHLSLRFPGQREDAETALFQNWHRDYDPSLGRYVQSDPIGLMGGINTYAYVSANPLNYVDPRGLDCLAVGGTVFCDVPGGPSVTFPEPEGWPIWLGPRTRFYHYYDKSVAINDASQTCVLLGLANDPTPGEWDTPASIEGSYNDATSPMGTTLFRGFTSEDLCS